LTGKVKLKILFGSYSPEYQQLIEGINLVLQLSLSTMSPSLPSLDKQGDTSG
jgi:hypothetical protein